MNLFSGFIHLLTIVEFGSSQAVMKQQGQFMPDVRKMMQPALWIEVFSVNECLEMVDGIVGQARPGLASSKQFFRFVEEDLPVFLLGLFQDSHNFPLAFKVMRVPS
jgi:hypothetical protein